jgi:hypothetical protein
MVNRLAALPLNNINFMQRISDFFRAILFDWRKKRAIRQARRSADLYRKKFLVLVWQGRPGCVSMQGVKKLIRQKKFPGLTAEKAREIALFEASPRNTSRPCS